MAGLIKSGEEFVESTGMEFNPQRGGLRPSGDEAKQRDMKVRDRWKNISKVGYEFVTVVNCLPWPIRLEPQPWMGGGMEIRAPKVKEGESAYLFTIKQARMDMEDNGDAKYQPTAIMPVEIALEFVNKYQEEGGVFFFKGETPPTNLHELIEAAHQKMLPWMHAMYAKGNDNWMRFNKQSRYISDRMRDAANFVFARREIDTLPEWMTVTRDLARTRTCYWCSETVRVEAKICRFCGRDPNGGDDSTPRTARALTPAEPESEGGSAIPQSSSDLSGENNAGTGSSTRELTDAELLEQGDESQVKAAVTKPKNKGKKD